MGHNSTQSLQWAIDIKPNKCLEIHEWTICEKMEMELRQDVLLVTGFLLAMTTVETVGVVKLNCFLL